MPDPYLELLKYLGPALLVALTAILTNVFQYLAKKTEIKNQSEFKARETLYNDFEQGIQNLKNENKNHNETLNLILTDSNMSDFPDEFIRSYIESGYMKPFFIKDNDFDELYKLKINTEFIKEAEKRLNQSYIALFKNKNPENLKQFMTDYIFFNEAKIQIWEAKKEKLMMNYIKEI